MKTPGFLFPRVGLLIATLALLVQLPRAAHAQGAALTTLHSFASYADNDGAQPVAGLTAAPDGSFYGVTEFGGVGVNDGSIFRITTAGALSILHGFTGSDGTDPRATLKLGADGNFYGSTFGGGNKGTLFKIDANGTLTTLHSFDGDGEGSYPLGDLVRDANGTLYGTTYFTTGNNSGNGTVFQFTAAGTLTTLHTFNGTDGADPTGLLAASDGFYYGVTPYGGGFGNGTIFKISPAGDFSTFYTFDTEGQTPMGALVQAADGNFYGTTSDGGANNAGIVFRLTPAGALTVLHVFTGTDGKQPLGELFQAADGNFYGTTNAGGAHGLGTVFRMTPAGGLRTLYSFPGGANGDSPQAALVQDGSGALYGTTSGTGGSGFGTVFKLTLAPVLADASASGLTGQAFGYQIAASNAPTSYTAAGLPPGLALDPSKGLIAGTPTQTGAFTVNVSATNLGGTVRAVLTLTITAPQADIQAVNILSPPTDINIVQGEPVDLEVAVDVLPGTLAKVAFNVDDAAGSAANHHFLGDSTAPRDRKTWQPDVLGDFLLSATATDVTGAPATSRIPIHVIAGGNPPVSLLLSGVDGRSFAAGSSVPLAALGIDANGAPLSHAQFFANGKPITTIAADSDAADAGVHRQSSGDSFGGIFQGLLKLSSALEDVLLTVATTDENGVTRISTGQTIHVASPAGGDTLRCAIASPATGSTLPTKNPTAALVSATETGGAVQAVELFLDEKSLGTVSAAPFIFAVTPPLSGSYALTAVATDKQGISKTSAPVLVNAATLPVVTAMPLGDGTATEDGERGKVVIMRTGGDLGAPLTVFYKAKGSAKPNVDFKPLTGSVTIPAGSIKAKVKIKPIDNETVDGTRKLKLRLLPPSDGSYLLGDPAVAKIKVIDND